MEKDNSKYSCDNLVCEREVLLNNLKNEIEKLQYDIAHVATHNKKAKGIRCSKIFLCFLRRIAPYVATAGITFGIFTSLHMTPFIMNDVKQPLRTKKELDSNGNKKYTEQYSSFKDQQGQIFHVGNWMLDEDGNYSREIKTYNIMTIDEEMIEKVINNLDLVSLEEIFNKPVDSVRETKNNLTEEELNEHEYLQAVYYLESEDDYIIVRETVSNNLTYTFVWFIITLFCEMMPISYREGTSNFDFAESVNRIKRKYPYKDKEELVKKLEIRKNNYNMFVGDK